MSKLKLEEQTKSGDPKRISGIEEEIRKDPSIRILGIFDERGGLLRRVIYEGPKITPTLLEYLRELTKLSNKSRNYN